MTPHSPGDATAAVGPGRLVGAMVGLTAAIGLMLLAFSAPSINSGPHDVPLAVAGPGPVATHVAATLEKTKPGAFEVRAHRDAREVTDAIEERDVVGGIVISGQSAEIRIASAAGAPFAALLRDIGAGLAAEGMDVTYTDVVPLTDDDPAGAGIAALALPLAIGGTVSAVLLSRLSRRRRRVRVAGSVAFAALTGLVATAILQYWLGAVDGGYWSTAGGVGLGIAAISLTVLGLESLFGYAGIAVGALTMVFVANPLSALATGPAWLPQPWGDIGQLLPIGAAGTVIRSAAFFGGAGAGQALVVLSAWMVMGLVLLALSPRRHTTGSGPGTSRQRALPQQRSGWDTPPVSYPVVPRSTRSTS